MEILLFVLAISSIVDLSLAIVGGRQSAIPPPDDPVVFVNQAGRFARVEGYRDKTSSLYTFRGLKYADPPIRENRFLRPKFKRLIGDVDAKKYGPPCPQPDFYDENKIIGDEDCLVLNIFTPKMPDETTGLPVFLWIHGGGYRYGSANQYEAYPIIQNDVVFVPIQYRLGTLGLLGDGTREFGGNVALFDMHAALRWVQEYIKYFGGDPKQIKVIGHGSGAQSAMYLSQSPIGRSSLNGVVAMSGSSLSQYAYDDEPVQSVEKIAKINNCPYHNDTELIKCMRSKSVEDIVKMDSKVQTERLMGQEIMKAMSGLVSFNPILETQDDQRGLPGAIVEKPDEFLKKDNDVKIPLLIGMTEHETSSGLDQNEINKIFKSGTEFLKSVGTAMKFKELLGIKNSSNSVPIINNLGLPSLTDYLTVPDNLDPEKLFSKLVEVTTDVFFNIPSYLSANLWGKFAPSFLYQFKYVGDNHGIGKIFLKPLPLVSQNQNTEGKKVAHGDDLGFLFNPCDVFGNRINGSELKTERDKNARKNLINMIVNFAYFNESQGLKLTDKLMTSFSSDKNSFISIGDKLEIANDFRFCQLSLWGAQLKSAQKITCEFLSEGIKKVSTSVKNIPGVGGVVGGGLKKFGLK